MVNLEEIRQKTPGNESEEHFLLKQVARYWLWTQGCRVISTEVGGLFSLRSLERRQEIKRKIKVTGQRLRRYEEGRCPVCQEPLSKKEGSFGCRNCGNRFIKEDVLYRYRKTYPSGNHTVIDTLGIEFGQKTKLKGVEVKVSRQDFKNGFCMYPEYTYLMTPKDMLDKDEVPKYIGLVEVDFEGLEVKVKPEVRVKGVNIKKRATGNIDKRFKNEQAYYSDVSDLAISLARTLTTEMMFKEGIGR